MSYVRFEDEPVWRMAIELAVGTFALTEHGSFSEIGGFGDQLKGAVVMASSKIAEGFEQGARQEMQECQSIARGAVAKVRSLLSLVDRLPAFAKVRHDVGRLNSMAQDLGRRLTDSIDSLSAPSSSQTPAAIEAPIASQAPAASPTNGDRPSRGDDRHRSIAPHSSDDLLRQLSQIHVLGGERTR
ncbi:MAG TPA: four helix bundle protein [Isosphaeraceae bacterium]|nr:four helix bundle protein [Isosphaeraceae bacterium]